MWAASLKLATLLADRGDLDGAERILRAGADADRKEAARLLADLLARRGDLDGLQARMGVGDWVAAERLANLLTEQDRGEEAERFRRFGLNPDGSIACG